MEEIKRNIPRDLFLHLLAVVTLYWSAVTFIMLMWQFINYFFPDALNFYYEGFNGTIRMAVSSLVIVFPVFICVSWYLNKLYSREAVVRESKIRKWLIYLTLFIASLVIIGDLVSTINTLLTGEITIRFILKALSIILVAGIIFGYYLDDVRKDTPTKLAKPFAWATSALVLIAIVGSFFIIGSPATARLVQFDQQKISDLTGVQWEVVKYWQGKEKLPTNLTDLNDKISGYTVPNDPQTNVAYEYNILNATTLSFELCAVFNKPSQANNPKMAYPYPVGSDISQNWDHQVGRTCFERTIDKQIYRPLNTVK
ncbi:MAG: DUF5671 domain-containing protein [Candidatus Staskawiczbacteria bacterium]|nr:DUF5671 domain-containing protein [Candidatus Staskawiczbacteria bacterium]